MEPLGMLKRLDPREIWPDEASDFTPWLRDNLSYLSEAVGLEIDLAEREVPVGDFSVDLTGKDLNSDRSVVIENQLTKTDHDHLGKVLTYAANLDAGIVIWIAGEFREEHRQVLDWLNAHSDEKLSFFGIQLELLQIDDSRRAPNFKVIAEPSDWEQQPREGRTERQQAYHKFFSELVPELKTRTPRLTSARKVGYDNWFAFSAGRSGLHYAFVFCKGNRFRVELYIDTGDKEENEVMFDRLYEDKEAIEEELEGLTLSWEIREDVRLCRVAIYRDGNIGDSPEELEALSEWGVDTMAKFCKVMSKRISSLCTSSSA